MAVDELVSAIADRITQAEAEIAALESARASLLGDGSSRQPARRGARRKSRTVASGAEATPPASETTSEPKSPSSEAAAPERPPSRSRRSRRKPATSASAGATGELLAGKLEAMLRTAEDGVTASAIASAAKARPAQVRELLQDLQDKGQIRQTGRGRGTRWRLVSDEERIAQRAAEL